MRIKEVALVIIPLLVVTVAFQQVSIYYDQSEIKLPEVSDIALKLEIGVPLFNKTPKTTYTQYKTHGPLYIDGNSNFILRSVAESWPGNGNETNPYIIARLNITGPSESHLIEIKNTNIHFRISNCQLVGGSIGIYFSNVTNGQLINNHITNITWGIFLEDSDISTVSENTITNNGRMGIYLWSSECNTLTDNTVTNNAWGILLKDSDNNVLSGNTVTNNGANGIALESSGYNTLTNNIVTNNTWGITFFYSDNSILLGNIVTNNSWVGISLERSMTNFLTKNIITHNKENGISLFSTNHSLISGNALINNSKYGIYIDNKASNNSVEFNGFYRHHVDGSHAFDSGLSNLFQYNFWDNGSTLDNNTDGFVDTPYPIAGEANNQDLFPRVMELVLLFPNEQMVLSGFVTIDWTPCHMFGDSVNYSVYYSPDGGTTWYLIKSGLATPYYIWDTTIVANGAKYLLKVMVTVPNSSWQETTISSQFSINNFIKLTSTSSPTSKNTTTRRYLVGIGRSVLLAGLQLLGLMSILVFVGVLFVAIKRRR